MVAMPPKKKPRKDDSGDVALGVEVEAAIKLAIEAYIAHVEATTDHSATRRGIVEAALKAYLADKGFWPPK